MKNENDPQFVILRDEKNAVYILDKFSDKKYYPSCGESLAQVCAYFEARPLQSGKKDMQSTLEKVMQGKKPITDMIESISTHQMC
jgi:hypothetical protein